jgi:hypothetical protein
MSDLIGVMLFIKNMLSDLIYLNGIIVTELINITENTAAIRRGEEFLQDSTCISEHNELKAKVIEIVKKYKDRPKDHESLEKHVLKHD